MTGWAAQLLALAATLAAYLLARGLGQLAPGHPLATPLLTASLVILLALVLLGIPISAYVTAAAPLAWWLGPAVVALAVPLAEGLRERGQVAAVVAILAGALAGAASAIVLASILGLTTSLTIAVSTRSVTSGIAAVVMDSIGGPAPLAVAMSIISGLLGAVLLPPLLRRLRQDDDATLGTAMGTAAHIIGTDALGRSRPAAVRHAARAMAVAGLATALLLPPLLTALAQLP